MYSLDIPHQLPEQVPNVSVMPLYTQPACNRLLYIHFGARSRSTRVWLVRTMAIFVDCLAE